MPSNYIPDLGDIIWIDFDLQAGREQGGHRPTLVLTPKAYNEKVGLLLCCPMTTKIKGYPFEVNITGKPANMALTDQISSLDWNERHATFKGKIADKELLHVKAKIAALLSL